MDERNDVDKMDEVMLPGFRFHPTDEELVGFYLKRKVQQRPLSIELIKQLDIYKYDPWDLPKLATGGEKEWYFYCPRDRKYRNSARPNRVTGAGFWKATGTDRPIYSSEGNKCIGLKKSLVFYKGRAAKGIKTDWMMHEFRLPSLADSVPTKRTMDRSTSIPANDSWAICRIFKKTSSTAHRAISHSWVSPLSQLASSDELAKSSQNAQFSSHNMSLTTDAISPAGIHLNYNNELQHTSTTTNPLFFPSYRVVNSFSSRPSQHPTSNGDLSVTSSFPFSPLETLAIAKGPVDVSSVPFNISPSLLGDHFGSKVSESLGIFCGSQDHCNGFSLTSLPQDLQVIDGNGNGNENASLKHLNGTHFDDQWENVPSIGFPFSLPTSVGIDHAWKPNFVLDSSSCPTEISTSFGTTKCYT